jgi:hypothetical protein
VVEAHEPSARVELDGDGVEAQLGSPGRVGATLGQPFACEQAQPPLLLGPYGGERPELGVSTDASRERRDPRLHLAENEAAGVGGDDVELSAAGAVVGVENDQSAGLQMGSGESLAGGSQGAPRVG